VIGRERTRVPRRHERTLWLRLYLHFVYILYIYVLFVWGQKAELPSVGQEGKKNPSVGRENVAPRA
jgi:hypothetical protein